MRLSGKVVEYFVVSRILVVSAALAGSRLIAANDLKGMWNVPVPFFNLFARWDSNMYLSIASNGYSVSSNWAFRPLFPMFLRVSSIPFSTFFSIDASLAVGGFFLDAVFFLAALFVIHNLTQRLFSERVADTAVLLLAFCPAGVFFSAIYPESLYLLLLAISFYFIALEKNRLSGVTGYFAGLTRPEGIFIALPVFLKSFKAKAAVKQKISSFVPCLITLCSLLTIFMLAWLVTGNVSVVFSSELGWDRVTLWQAILSPSRALNWGFLEFYVASVSTIAISVASVSGFFIQNRTRLSEHPLLPYYVYALSLLLFYLVVADAKSLTRYLSALVPVYWALALWMEKKKFAKPVVLTLFAVQMVVGTVLFVNWYPFV